MEGLISQADFVWVDALKAVGFLAVLFLLLRTRKAWR